MANKQPRCSSCHAGEIENHEGIGFFTGYLAAEERPFRGWLCDDHRQMHDDDNDRLGAKLLRQVDRA